MNTSTIQILLIEDSQTDAFLLEDALNRDAFNLFALTISERLGAGLNMLRKSKFDLVMLDLGLPDSQGLETFQKLHQVVPDTPVIVLSGLMDERLALEAVQAGAQDYLVKGPTSWEIAPRAIRYAIERQQSKTALRESEIKLRTLIEQSSEGIALIGEKGNILEWNQAMERITGLSRAQAVLLPVWDLQTRMIPSEQRSSTAAERLKARFSELLQTGNLTEAEKRVEVEIESANGERKTVTQTVFTIKTAGGYRLGTIVLDITERKQSEESLRASETKYRKLFDEMSNGSALHQIICDDVGNPVDYITLDVNAAFESLLGIKREQVIGRKASELLPPDELKSWVAIFGSTALTGTSTHYEMYSSLNERYFEGVAFSPELGKFAVTFSDVTDRKLAEEKLNQSETRYRLATKATNDVIWEWNAKSHQLMWSENAQVVFGYSPEESGHDEKWWDERIHPDDHERVLRKLNDLVAGDETIWSEEYRFLLNDGSYAYISDHAYVERSRDGEPLRMIGAMSNITERKQAEQALYESEERFRSLYNNATIGLYRTTPDGRILMCNPAAVRLLGFETFDELAKRNLEEDGFEPDYPRREFHERMERDGRVVGLEAEWTKRDGMPIFVRESAMAIRDGQGKILYYDGTFEDITERKRAEEAIRLSEKKFKTLFEIAPTGIAVLDQEQNIIDANYSLQRITGLKKNELVAGANHKRTYLRPDGTVMPPDEFASARALKEEMPIFDIETGIITEHRGVVWTQVSAVPLDMPDASLVVITQDISERKLSEQTLRQRLAELETLHESGLSLSQLLEPQQIGQKIIDVLAEKLDWYHTTIRLYHPESDSLELLAYNLAWETTKEEWQQVGERFRTIIARPGDGLSGWVLQHGETVRSGDLMRDPRYLETVPGIRSGLYVPIKTGERAIGVISVESEKPDYFTAEDEHLVATLATQAAVSLENIRLFKDLQKSNDDLFRAYDETIEGWSHALDLRDKETEGHTQRVTTLTEELAHEMGIPDSELIHFRWGALLHDIGKMGVPDRILLKPDKLTDDEWVIMREHSTHAYHLLSHIEFLRTALNIPHYHHEKWDGSGYPDGLQGEQIPLEARIFAVIDVFDALTSDRPYRPAWPKDKAIRYIREQSGSHFDPQVVEAFMKLISRK